MIRRVLVTLAAAACTAAGAQSTTKPNEQVVVPEVDRREVKIPKLPNNDFIIGIFGGTYATQNFGSAGVKGVRLGYHVTEDFFVEGAYGRTNVSDAVFRQISLGGIFPNETEKLTYYNVSVGVNVMTGEAFFGRNRALPSAFYFIAGTGTTKFFDQKKQTLNLGFGTRLVIVDWFALQADVREHMFSLDLLGKRQNTRNPEITLGATFFF
jgi:outer membrane beta-barrel protein